MKNKFPGYWQLIWGTLFLAVGIYFKNYYLLITAGLYYGMYCYEAVLFYKANKQRIIACYYLFTGGNFLVHVEGINNKKEEVWKQFYNIRESQILDCCDFMVDNIKGEREVMNEVNKILGDD